MYTHTTMMTQNLFVYSVICSSDAGGHMPVTIQTAFISAILEFNTIVIVQYATFKYIVKIIRYLRLATLC